MTDDFDFKGCGLFLCFLLAVTLVIAFCGGVIYAVVHFALKYW